MSKVERSPMPQPETSRDVISELLREGARQLLLTALETEVEEYLQRHARKVDEQGRHLLVRNGYLPERTVLTGLGPLPVRQPRIADRRPPGERVRFSSTPAGEGKL